MIPTKYSLSLKLGQYCSHNDCDVENGLATIRCHFLFIFTIRLFLNAHFFQIGAVENDAVEEQIYKIVQTAADGMDTDTISTLTAAIPALDRQVVPA